MQRQVARWGKSNQKTPADKNKTRLEAHQREKQRCVFGFSQLMICFAVFFRQCHILIVRFLPGPSNHRVWGIFLGCQKIGPKKHQCPSDRSDKNHPKQTQPQNQKKAFKTKKESSLPTYINLPITYGPAIFPKLSVVCWNHFNLDTSVTFSNQVFISFSP